jgi:hypothetical protein
MKKATLVRGLFALTLALGSLFVPGSTEAGPGGPCPRPNCTTSFCTGNSDCTAAPGGRCDHFCQNLGCCVY